MTNDQAGLERSAAVGAAAVCNLSSWQHVLWQQKRFKKPTFFILWLVARR